MSSKMPSTTMMTPPSSMPRSWGVSSSKSSTLSRKPKKMASPPMPGDGVVVHPAVVLGHVHRAHPEGQERTTGVGPGTTRAASQGGRHQPIDGISMVIGISYP